MNVFHDPTPNARRHYRSAAIAFHQIPSLPAPLVTHLRRYLYVVLLISNIIKDFFFLSNEMISFIYFFFFRFLLSANS